jgi:hypothetical protein
VSLINEALRKARQEELEHSEARRTRIRYPAWITPPREGGLGLALILGAVIGVGAACVGGVTVWWILSRGQPPATVSDEGTPTVENVEAAAEGSDQAEISPRPATREAAAAATSVGEDVKQATPREEVESAPRRPERELSISTRPEQAPSETAPEPEENVFFLDAKVGDVELELDYLVYRSEDPFAEINGTEVRVGSHIEGFEVVEIARDQVTLRKGDRTVILRVH